MHVYGVNIQRLG